MKTMDKFTQYLQQATENPNVGVKFTTQVVITLDVPDENFDRNAAAITAVTTAAAVTLDQTANMIAGQTGLSKGSVIGKIAGGSINGAHKVLVDAAMAGPNAITAKFAGPGYHVDNGTYAAYVAQCLIEATAATR
ncbi:hypothetical protein H6758_00665 [Candidatus Nomurabacteria bacterium]|nr:hypothetical protein [Candidatus Nomurabacteria bacterium]